MNEISYQVRAIDQWPYETTKRRRSRSTFSSSWGQTIELLSRELRHMAARNVVFQLDVQAKDIRIDGKLRANARPDSPRVIISFDSNKVGSLSFPCDSCEYWQHNIRSIALGLGALRAVDRYGVTRKSEQYRGWEKLPGPDGTGAIWKVPEDVRQAMSLVNAVAETDVADPIEALVLAKKFQLQFHPDKPDGDPKMSRAFNAAVRLLRGGAA